MNKKSKIIAIAVAVLAVIGALAWYLHGVNIPVLETRGTIGHKERGLMIFTLLLAMVVILPVFALTIIIAWRYREGNTKARVKYSPDLAGNRAAEFTWWAIPITIIVILSVVTWMSSYALDPWKPLPSVNKPVTIQVVSLDWRWLFIYPDQHIASMSYVQFPVNTPVNFYITSDSVMNSFWIPQLGGQMYSMPGMSTQLHLEATQAGNYDGSSANISGNGFAGMKFTAKASSKTDFDTWVQLVKQSSHHLTGDVYQQAAQPSKDTTPLYYASVDDGLYDSIVMKYMSPAATMPRMGDKTQTQPAGTAQTAPAQQPDTTQNMPGMDMSMPMNMPMDGGSQ